MADCPAAGAVGLEQLFQIARACIQNDASIQLTADKMGLDIDRTDIEVEEISEISNQRVTEDLAIYQAQYTSIMASADVAYNAALGEANWQVYEISNVESLHAYTITNEASYTVQATTQISQAQQQQILGSASVDASTASSVAGIQVSQISGEATIDVGRLSKIASIQSTMITTEATKSASGASSVATVQANQITTEATTQAATTRTIGTLQATAITTEAGTRAQEATGVAAIQVTTIGQDAYWQALVTSQSSQARQRGDLGEIAQRSAQITGEASIRADATIQVATIDRTYKIYDATQKQAGSKYSADQDYAAAASVADTNKTLVQYRADQQSLSVHSSADTAYAIDVLDANTSYNTKTAVATTDATASNYRADQGLVEVQVRENLKATLLANRVAYLQTKWDEMYPLFVATQPAAVRTPGLGPQPSISCRGVYTPSMIQQMANVAIGNADAKLAGELRSARLAHTGRGVSATSPVLEAFRLSMATAQAKEAGQAITGMTLEAGNANAARVLAGQQQRNAAFMAQQEAYLQAEANNIDRQVALFDNLSQIAASA